MAEESTERRGIDSLDVPATDREHVFGTSAYQSTVNPTEIVDAEGVHFTANDYHYDSSIK